MNTVDDALSWDKFFKNAKSRKHYPPKKIDLFNRLVAHTENFFLISAIGAFTPGYLMIITKELLPSFSLIKDKNLEELKLLIKYVSEVLNKTYKRKVITFEHGMCACLGGLDRAHVHVMTINKKINEKILRDSINKVLIDRKAGINSIDYNGYSFENIHDINQIISDSKPGNYKINGKQLTIEDIRNNLNLNEWPISPRSHVMKGGHYVYFKSPFKSCSFLTNKNFQTQMGRQIIFEAEKKVNPELKKFSDKVLKDNLFANIWKWQEFPFKDNMLETMSQMVDGFASIKTKLKKYNFKYFY